MEIGNKKYLFEIYKAKLNRKGHIVFKVSTEEIKLSNGTSKKMIQLPCGKYNGVRFYIDGNPAACAACLDVAGPLVGLLCFWPCYLIEKV
jgi:hypothetical protein